MIIFINEKPIRVLETAKFNIQFKNTDFDQCFDAVFEHPKDLVLVGQVCVLNPTESLIHKIFEKLESGTEAGDLGGLYFVTDQEVAIENAIKSRYAIIKAGGGIVVKNNQVLMINRLGKWDLPKGKLEKGESSKMGALREVEEETGVKVSMVQKIGTTYHTYTQGSQKIMKRTKWFLMDCLSDTAMAPQTEEGIQELAWKGRSEQISALTNSYSSIRYIMKMYDQLTRGSENYGSL